MTQPLCFDLFCGLGSGEAQLGGRADATVHELVACRAENPDHFSLRVGHYTPSAVALVLGAVRYFKNSVFATGLARAWKVRVLSPEPSKNRVLERPVHVVRVLFAWMTAHPQLSNNARSLSRTVGRAILLIGVRRNDIKVLSAVPAVAAILCDVGLLAASAAAYTRLTTKRTVALVWALGGKRFATTGAE
jgi:hypothetical protein